MKCYICKRDIPTTVGSVYYVMLVPARNHRERAGWRNVCTQCCARLEEVQNEKSR